jgi:hypothetical protein
MKNMETTTVIMPKFSSLKAKNVINNYFLNLPKFDNLNVDTKISTKRVDNNYYLVINCIEDDSNVVIKCPISRATYFDISKHVEKIMRCANLL